MPAAATVPGTEGGAPEKLVLGGVAAEDLVEAYGSPLYVLEEDKIRAACRGYREAFAAHYPDYEIMYACKANCCVALCQLMAQEGLGLDVASAGELYTALKAGVAADRLLLHGNNKSAEELEMALSAGVGRIVVDNLCEVELLERAANRQGKTPTLLLRVTPGIRPDTHEFISTGQVDTKFGMPPGAPLERAIARIREVGFDLSGLHCHIGSQILETGVFAQAAERMMELMASVGGLRELDLGGGLGIRYTADDTPPGYDDYVRTLTGAVRRAAERLGVKPPRILIEPGRSIVGEAGTTLYRVGTIKAIPGVREYLAVDGGMADNPRVALYGAKYRMRIISRSGASGPHTYSVTGKCCESGDMLGWDVSLAQAQPGDLLAVFSTGAYNFSMASNYNRLPRPAQVLVSKGKARLIVERQSLDDLLAQDRPLA